VALSLAAGALGAQSAVRRAVTVPPAEAMRPEAPARYRRSFVERWRLATRLSQTTRMVLRNMERHPVRSAMSIVGIAFAGAVLLIGLAFIDVMDVLIDEQFTLTMRQSATVSFVQPRSAEAVYAMQRLPGVGRVEPMRIVVARLRVGAQHRTLAITGLTPDATLARVVERSGREIALPPEGLVLSKMLADRLGVGAGGLVRVETLEGARPTRNVRVAALVDDSVGLHAYMAIDALRRLMHEGETVSAVALAADPAVDRALYARLKMLPAVAGVAVRELTLQNFRDIMAQNMNLQIFINVFLSAVIAFGVVYNSARVSLSERSHELASLRVLGFTRAEISLVLLGELTLVTLLSLPLGSVIGYLFGLLVMTLFNNELYRLPFTVTPQTLAWTWLTIIAAAAVSAFAVRRRLDRLDLVAVLKAQE
jgi:putative ABC transport system permease protein